MALSFLWCKEFNCLSTTGNGQQTEGTLRRKAVGWQDKIKGLTAVLVTVRYELEENHVPGAAIYSWFIF